MRFDIWLVMAFFMLPPGLSAQEAKCYPGLPCPDGNTVVRIGGTGIITLVEDTVLEYKGVNILDGTIIRTDGHKLEIKVAEDMVIDGSARIESFRPDFDYRSPPQAPSGTQGQSWDRGPKTEGRCRSCRGSDGGQGGKGVRGAVGASGRDAGVILIQVGGKASGILEVSNTGQRGGPGGPGGPGGNGGTGQQGGRGKSGTFDCSKGPGHGGNGGRGGDGGDGGPGGPGGRGGVVLVQAADDSKLTLRTNVAGGQGGAGGASGRPGNGGEPGYGGRGDGLCQGRETERLGSRGPHGGPGQTGPTGQRGAEGSVVGF